MGYTISEKKLLREAEKLVLEIKDLTRVSSRDIASIIGVAPNKINRLLQRSSVIIEEDEMKDLVKLRRKVSKYTPKKLYGDMHNRRTTEYLWEKNELVNKLRKFITKG